MAVTAAAFDASATARGLTDSSQCFVSRKDILVKNIIITARGLMARGEAGSVVTVVSVVLITFPHWPTRSVMPYLYGALWLDGVARPPGVEGFRVVSLEIHTC